MFLCGYIFVRIADINCRDLRYFFEEGLDVHNKTISTYQPKNDHQIYFWEIGQHRQIIWSFLKKFIRFKSCGDVLNKYDIIKEMSQEVKKKKKTYKKKVDKSESDINISKSEIKGEFSNVSMSDLGISSILSSSEMKDGSKVESNIKKLMEDEGFRKKGKEGEGCNLHHDADFKDLMGQFEDKEELKSLKKYIKKAFPAQSIELFAGARSPTLKFQYQDKKRDNELRVRSLADLLKANKQLGECEYDTIYKIFDQIYCRINEKDKKIVSFLHKLAEKRRIELTIADNRVPKLYYEYDQKLVNFTLFDVHMRILSFSSEVVGEYKFGQEEMKIWSAMIKGIEQRRSEKEMNYNQNGEYEVSSDEDGHGFGYEQSMDLGLVRKRTKELMETDLTAYRDELDEKDARCNALKDKSDDRDKPELDYLLDQVFELHHNIENFQETIRYVQSQLKGRKVTPLRQKNLLKILIIAQKQLKSQLPIVARKQEIFKKLDKTDLIILEGETGSGKSTQLPQMMCEYLKIFQQPKTKPVLITQPRRLATRTVAERVASQMEERIGGFVDYATSSHKVVQPGAKIVFKLDSVVLDELTNDRMLGNYSCLIIDQAHERTVSIDVILGLVKELQKERKGFKVIVTSASLDGKLFEQYFGQKVFKVSGRLFPVDVVYSPYSHESDMVKKIEKVLKKQIMLNNSQLREQYKGDILVFCTGVDDINMLCAIFQKYVNHRCFRVLPLHGKIAVGEQKEVFLQTKEYKIIFATRIAQTSITINGVKVVVDPGVDRQLVYDQKYRVSSRKLVNISQSSAKQRAGRAGRTQRGYCFRLYSEVEMRGFRINKTPEIDNMALDTLVLRLKSLGVDNIFTFPYVKVPDTKALEQSVQTLQMIGGLSPDKMITTIGKLLLKLNIEPFLGRSIVQALICEYVVKQTNFLQAEQGHFKSWQRGEVDGLKSIKTYVVEILCMVMNASNLFFGNINLRERIQQIKYTKFSNQKGDFLYLQNIYSQFLHKVKSRDKGALDHWIKSNYLTKKTLFQVQELIFDINEIIKNFKLDTKDPSITYLADTIKLKLKYCKDVDDVILSCMVTSFSVNLCLYSNNPRVGYTLVLQKKTVNIYGTSTLAQQGLFPKWIVCYDLKTNDKNVTYCTIAHQVNFDFLKRTVENYVFQRLKLREAEKMNPFYSQVDRVLPTAVIADIRKEYLDHQNHAVPLLQHVNLYFNEDKSNNVLSVFYPKELQVQEVLPEGTWNDLTLEQVVVNYIEEKKLARRKGKYVTNVVSNIFAQFTDGFMVKDINFADVEIEFVVRGKQYHLNMVRNSLDGIHCYPFGEMLKIISYGDGDARRVRKLLEEDGLEYDEQKREKKEDTLMGRIYMRFYTGQLKGEPLFIYYGKNQDEKLKEIIEILQDFQNNEKKGSQKLPDEIKRNIKLVCECRFKKSFKATGIKCYGNADAFQLKQAFQNLIITGILPYQFDMPMSIREFRNYDSTAVQARTEGEWEKIINNVFDKHGLKGLEVKVKGERREDDDPDLNKNNYEKQLNTELTAIVTSKSLQTIDDMVRELDGRSGVIGLGKIHFRHNYKQLVAKVNKRCFKTLLDKYEHIRKFYETTSHVKIETHQKKFGKAVSVFINIRSPVRQNLLKPTEQLKMLFYPFIKRLTSTQFNFLNNTDQGNNQLQHIEDYFEYKIYFGFIKRSRQLKIYCLEEEYEEVEKMIDDIFLRHQVYVENVSYRCKGLAKVQQVLGKLMDRNHHELSRNKKSKLVLYYNINFKFRQVQIYGDYESTKAAVDGIRKLGNIQLGSCNLCGKNVEKAFRLTYCQHQFCQKCLGDYINQSKKEDDDQSGTGSSSTNTSVVSISEDAETVVLVCPQENCGRGINPADLEVLLSTEEFQQISMKRLRDFVKKDKRYFYCPTVGCQQIFEGEKVEREGHFECVMCGRWFCSNCRQPHQYFSCGQWRQKLARGELLRFGYKRCYCGYVIQKETKEKIVKCKNCKLYLCWKCNNGKRWEKEFHCRQHVQTCKL